ncbi:MAG: hypothetical protein WC010_01405 [Candidatus Absconditabacterales bacterium]
MKKPLMERINSVVIIDEVKAEKEELNVIMYDIKNDIEILKQEINGTQETLALNNIEKEINMFCEKIGQPTYEEEIVAIKETPEQIYQNAIMQQQTYQLQAHQEENHLYKEQAKIMNQNISKFLIVYKEKDKIIDTKSSTINERNKSIYILQQKLNEAEMKIKKFIAEQQDNSKKDGIIEEKVRSIEILKQRLQEV